MGVSHTVEHARSYLEVRALSRSECDRPGSPPAKLHVAMGGGDCASTASRNAVDVVLASSRPCHARGALGCAGPTGRAAAAACGAATPASR